MQSGIYAIVNTISSKSYVGSAINLTQRKAMHFTRLRCNKHPSKHLQASFSKYGEAAFEFRVLEIVAPDAQHTLIQREQYWMDLISPAYNKRLIAESNLGVEFGPEWRAAQSASLKAFRDRPEGEAHKSVLLSAVQKSWADPEKRAARIDAIKAAWTPEKRAYMSAGSKARQTHLAPDGTHFGTHRVWTEEEKVRSGAKMKEAWAKRLTTTEDDIRRIATETNPAWTVLEMTGVRNVDKVLIHCSVHNHDQWQGIAKLRHAQRGCKLCGYQRSSDVQAGRSKPQTIV